MSNGITNWAKNNKIYIFFFFFVLIKGLLWTWSIPPFFVSDELPHFAYTQYLVEEKAIPKNTGALSPLVTTMSEELDKASKLLQERHLIWSFSHMKFSEQNEPIPEEFNSYSRQTEKGNYKNSAAIYSPLYYAIEAVPYILGYHYDIFTRFYLMRVFSLIFLFIALISVYKIALLVSEKRLFAITAVAIVSLMPSINSSSFGGINNDAALIAFSQILFYLLLKALKNVNSAIMTRIGIGAVLGLTLLAKPQGVIFIPIVAAVFLYKGIKTKIKKQSVIALFFIFFIAALMAAPFYVEPIKYFINNPSETINQTQSILSFKNITAATGLDLLRRFSLLSEFWLQAQLFTVFYPFYINSFILALELAAAIGLIYIGKDYFKRVFQPNQNFYIYIALCALTFFALDSFYTMLFYKGALLNNYYNFAAQGRYYFPVIGPLIILFLAGLCRFFNKLNIPQNFVFISLFLFFLILHNYSLINIILQYNYL